MKRFILFASVSLLALPALAQSLPEYNCMTTGCGFGSDPYPPPPAAQPATCEFYVCAPTSTATDCQSPTLKSSLPPTGPAGALYCSWPNQVFAAGIYRVVSRASSTTGKISVYSNILSFESGAGAPLAPVLKITSKPVP